MKILCALMDKIMPHINTFDAAKTVCHFANWGVSNLQLQKILYIAHMCYMGNHQGNPLLDEEFEAWDYGPVLPELYHKLKMFGSAPVRNIFFENLIIENGDEGEILKEAAQTLVAKEPGRLVSFTHRDKGAWDKTYMPGMKGLTISNSDIFEEFQALHVQRILYL